MRPPKMPFEYQIIFDMWAEANATNRPCVRCFSLPDGEWRLTVQPGAEVVVSQTRVERGVD